MWGWVVGGDRSWVDFVAQLIVSVGGTSAKVVVDKYLRFGVGPIFVLATKASFFEHFFACYNFLISIVIRDNLAVVGKAVKFVDFKMNTAVIHIKPRRIKAAAR